MGSVEFSVQMFLFFLHNYKSYLLLSVCLMGRNLGRLFKGWESGGGGGGQRACLCSPLALQSVSWSGPAVGCTSRSPCVTAVVTYCFHPVIYSFFPPSSSQMRGLKLGLKISCCTVKD